MKNTLRRLSFFAVATFASAFSFLLNAETNRELRMTAHDFLTKVYGICPNHLTKGEAAEYVSSRTGLVPVDEENGSWIESENGFEVNYYGLRPATSALAIYDKEQLSDYGYFFEFDYENGARDLARSLQSEFCGSLLQELSDIGADLSSEEENDSLFNVVGSYPGLTFRLRLVEEPAVSVGDDGAFLLLMTVSPEPVLFLSDND